MKYNKYEQNYASVSVPPPPAPHKLGIAGNLKPDLHYKNKTSLCIGKHTLPGLVSTFVWKIQTNPESTWTWCIYISVKGSQSWKYVKVIV